MAVKGKTGRAGFVPCFLPRFFKVLSSWPGMKFVSSDRHMLCLEARDLLDPSVSTPLPNCLHYPVPARSRRMGRNGWDETGVRIGYTLTVINLQFICGVEEMKHGNYGVERDSVELHLLP